MAGSNLQDFCESAYFVQVVSLVKNQLSFDFFYSL